MQNGEEKLKFFTSVSLKFPVNLVEINLELKI